MESSEAASQSGQTAANTRSRAIVLVLLAALFWSTSGFFAKANVFAGWHPLLLAFWRATFACMVLAPMVRKPILSWKLLPMGGCFVLMNITYLTAMVQGSAANAIWLQGTAPVWVLLVGVLFCGEAANRLDVWLIVLEALGVGIILFFESRGQQLVPVLWGVASGVTFAATVLSLRLLREFDSAWLVTVNHFTAALCLSWIVPWTGVWPSGTQWLYLAGFGMFQMGLSYLLFTRGVRTLSGHEAAGIGLLEPILAPLWVYLAWNEAPAWWTLVGGCFILLGLAIRYLVPWWRNARRANLAKGVVRDESAPQ